MEITNPRFFKGNISGLGMTADDNGRKVDTRYGVRIDITDGCLIEHPLGEITLAYAMDGVLEDGTADRVRGLFLLSPTTAARVVSELTSLLQRADPAAAKDLVRRLLDAVAPRPADRPADHAADRQDDEAPQEGLKKVAGDRQPPAAAA